MNTTENLSLDLYSCPEDKSVNNGEIINTFSKNFEKIDKFSKDIKDTVHTIHGLHDTKTDEVVTADDADKAGVFKKISVYGAYEQLATTGKNVVGIYGDYEPEQYGVSVSVDNDVVTLNGIISGEDTEKKIILGNNSKFSWDSGKRYRLSIVHMSGTTTLGSGTGDTFTVLITSPTGDKSFDVDKTQTDIANYGIVGTSFSYDSGVIALVVYRNGTKFDNFKFALQVELGTRFTSYEPYTGGKASPSLDYPQEPIMLQNPVVKISGSDKNDVVRSISFDLPETHQYVGMLPDTTHDNVEISDDGTVEFVYRVWHKKLKISDMDNAENYPGWSIPKTDELMRCLQDNSHALVSCINSINIQLKMNTVGDTIRIFGEKVDFGDLTQPQLTMKYPNTYVDIYGKIETGEIREVIGRIDPILVPSSTINVWTDGNMICDTQVDYPRDINIIIKKIEEQLNALTSNS